MCVYQRTHTDLHTLLAATLHRLLHFLRERRPVVALEAEPPAPEPERGAASGGSSGLAPPPALHPGEGLGALAEGGATPQPMVVPHRPASTGQLCGQRGNW